MMSPVALRDHLFANSGSTYANEHLFFVHSIKCIAVDSILVYSLHFILEYFEDIDWLSY
jgi:hypothetical protein